LAPLPKPPDFGAGEHKAERLRSILGRFARENRTAKAKPFYSIREVCQHFRLPASTVSKAYAQLEQEGILLRVRASGTLLQGKAETKQLTVQSVMGIPVSVSCFLTLQGYRTFHKHMHRALRQHGFMTAISFYEAKEETGALAERLLQARADCVLWYLPDAGARQTAMRLRDHGVRIIGISDGGLPSIPCRYEVRRESALRVIMRDWVTSGIELVRIVQANGTGATDAERTQELLAEMPLRVEHTVINGEAVERFLRGAIEKPKSGVILLAAAAALCAMRAPQTFERLLRGCRVALVDGPVSIPFEEPPNAPVDLVVVDWHKATLSIVNELLIKKTALNEDFVSIKASAQVGASLGEFVQRL
jgi:hypothetical protein